MKGGIVCWRIRRLWVVYLMKFPGLMPGMFGQLPGYNAIYNPFENSFAEAIVSPAHQAVSWKFQRFDGRIGGALGQVRVTSWQRWTMTGGVRLPVDVNTEVVCMVGLNRDSWKSGSVTRNSPHLEARASVLKKSHLFFCAVQFDGSEIQDVRQPRVEISGQISARILRQGDAFDVKMGWVAQTIMPAVEWRKQLGQTWQFGLFYQLRPLSIGWNLSKSHGDFLGSSIFSFSPLLNSWSSGARIVSKR